MNRNRRIWIVWSFALVLALAGCGYQGTEHAGDHGADHEVPPAAAVELDAAMQAKLAAADLADGEADQVVKNCAGCNLGMEGSAEHVVSAGDYTMHFCSGACRDAFNEDLAGSLQALVVPEQDAEPEQATP